MGVYIHNIECLVPETVYSQSYIRDRMKNWLRCPPKTGRRLENIYDKSEIHTRHSVISDPDGFFKTSSSAGVTIPTTGARNDMFTDAAKDMFVELARRAVDGCEDINLEDITHIVTVSCTGFFNPGPDYEIIKALGLNKNIQRFNIGFMGCYAAFPALRLARAICLSEPDSVVLIAAVELCTLHAQLKQDLDSMMSAALFADGGAAVIVSGRPPVTERPAFKLHRFDSTIIPDSETDMAWTIGDTGFEMVLSQYVPRIIESNIGQIINPILEKFGLKPADIKHWAVHPGGKAILDRIESCLQIQNGLAESRRVLRRFGNMSSATVLFVLKEILKKPNGCVPEPVCAMAFGPGLTVEAALLSKELIRSSSLEQEQAAAYDWSGQHVQSLAAH